jgi:hypothetical protein
VASVFATTCEVSCGDLENVFVPEYSGTIQSAVEVVDEVGCVPPALVKYCTDHAKSTRSELEPVSNCLPEAKMVEVVPDVPRSQETEVPVAFEKLGEEWLALVDDFRTLDSVLTVPEFKSF